MGSHGIRDRVAIIGMGCTAFGEHWDKSADDMLVESATAATAAAGIGLDDIDAFWVGTMGSGTSGLTLSKPLRLPYKPVTRIENMCATGSETLRNACYAVASGAYDVAMAIGVEKLKDSGFSGLAGASPPGGGDDGKGDTTAPGNFSLLATAYAEETIKNSPLVAGMLGIFELSDTGYDFTTFPEVVASATDAYQQAGIANPRAELALAEVHDCFTPTELVLMEDLGFAERGQGWKDVLSGSFDFGGGPGECVSFVSVVGTELGTQRSA